MPNEIVSYTCYYAYPILGVLFVILGTVFKVIFNSFSPFTDHVNTNVMAVMIIATGCLLILYNILECACRKRLLTIFCFIVFPILLFMQIGALGYGCYQTIDYKDFIYKDIRSSVQAYKTNDTTKIYFGKLEERMDCCGVDGPKDYPTVIPVSCCPVNAVVDGKCKMENSYDIGCAARIYHETMWFIMIFSAIILVLLLLQVCTGIFLCIKTGNYRLGANEEVQRILAINEEN